VFRTSFESFIDIGFASVYNTYNIRWESSLDYYSNAVAFVWIVIFVIEMISILIIYLKFNEHYSEESIKDSKVIILLENFKDGKKLCMLDHFIFFIRRGILIFILIFAWGNGLIQAYLFLVTCASVLAFKVIVRPFKNAILNVQDILFEIILSMVILLFATFKDPSSELADSGRFMVLGMICFALVISLIVINYTITLITTIKECVERRRAKKLQKYKISDKKLERKNTQSPNYENKSEISEVSEVSHFMFIGLYFFV
jgi:hypothetical protein